MKNKFSVQDIFYHKDKNIFMMVDAVDYIRNKGYLYTLKVLKQTHAPEELKNEDDWKKYYERKLEETCVLAINQKTMRTIYGKIS